MSLVAHLREFRNRTAIALLSVGVATAICFWWYDHGLGQFIRAPYCSIPADDRALASQSGDDCRLLVTDVFGGALIRVKIAFIAGLVLSAPFWLWQVWGFLAPGLRTSEKRHGVSLVTAASTLFAMGAVLAYISLKAGLTLLLGLAGENVAVALTAQDYIGFVISVLLAFGVSFELPLFAVALNLVGVLSYRMLARSRRWIYFLTIVFSAVVTPTQDPFTLLLLALPMGLLFEVSIQIARIVDRRRARTEGQARMRDLDDDAASPLDTSPSRLEGDGFEASVDADLHDPR